MRGDRARPRPRRSGPGRRCRSRTRRSTASRWAARPRDLTRRRLLQWGVAGFASVYGAKELGWDDVWESVAEAAEAPPGKCLVLLYLAGGNDGLNVVLPNGAGDSAQANYSAYANARQDIGRMRRPDARRPGRLAALTGPGGDAARVHQRRRLDRRGGDNGDANYGFDTLYGDGIGGAGLGPRGHARGRRPEVLAQPLRQLGHLVRGQLRPQQQDGLARPLDRPQRQRDNPLQAISIDTALSKSIRTSVQPGVRDLRRCRWAASR